MRADKRELNDIGGGNYISLRAIKALYNAKVELSFTKREVLVSTKDVTEETNKRLAKLSLNQIPGPKARERKTDFDPYAKRG